MFLHQVLTLHVSTDMEYGKVNTANSHYIDNFTASLVNELYMDTQQFSPPLY